MPICQNVHNNKIKTGLKLSLTVLLVATLYFLKTLWELLFQILARPQCLTFTSSKNRNLHGLSLFLFRQWKEQKTKHAVLDSLDCIFFCVLGRISQLYSLADGSITWAGCWRGASSSSSSSSLPPKLLGKLVSTVWPTRFPGLALNVAKKRHLYTVHLYLLRREFAAKYNYCLEF